MDFSDKEMKVLLQALYRFRGEVSGASQSEQNKLGLVSSVIDKIEERVGPVKAEYTHFDEEMARSLAVLSTGKASPRKAGAEFDKGGPTPKVKKASSPRAASTRSSTAAKGKGEKAPRARAAKTSGPKKAGSGKTKS
jgi:hypothetical protein